MINIFGLYKDDHEEVVLSLEYLGEIFFVPEVDVPIMIDMGLIAEIVVLHVVIRVKHIVIEHVSKHVLLSQKLLIRNIRQITLAVYPSLTAVSYAYPLVSNELHS